MSAPNVLLICVRSLAQSAAACSHRRRRVAPAGNRPQLFDLDTDPQELHDLYGSRATADVAVGMEGLMAGELYGEDRAWTSDDRLLGMPEPACKYQPDHGLCGQLGWR